jgi:hypothetical protein
MTVTDFQWQGLGSKAAYLLENDGTDSILHHTDDYTSPGVIWTDTAISGVYTKIRVTSTQGEVYIFGNSSPGGDFTVQGTQDVPGLNTGIHFDSGDTISVTATGLWGYDFRGPIFGPDGDSGVTDPSSLLPSADLMALLGRIGTSGAWALLGASGSFVASTSGFLYLIGNDVPAFFDNTGSVDVEVNGGAGSFQSRYSTDYSATFATLEVIGIAPGLFSGMDTQKIGSVVLAGATGQVMKATSGGAWAAYGDPMPALAQPSCIVIPRYKSGGASNSGSTPDYIVASNALTAGNESVWYVSSAGTVFTDLTPLIGGQYALAVSEDCIAASYKVYNRYSALFNFGGTVKLLTSVNAGSSFTDRGAVASDAVMVCYRNGDASGNQIFVANGSSGIIVSPSHGSNLLTGKQSPSSDPVIWLYPFG